MFCLVALLSAHPFLIFLNSSFKMMGTLLVNNFSIAPRKLAMSVDRRAPCCTYGSSRKKNMKCLRCKVNGNMTSNGLSSFSTDKLSVPKKITMEHGEALMETENLVLSPNGKTKEETKVKLDLVPNGGNNTFPEYGIGIDRFFRGKVLLVTGVTGFLAKVLVEKILRTVPEVGKIFLLIKTKSKEAAMERLKSEIINTELFKYLHQVHGEAYESFMFTKLVPVVGNVCEFNLGIETELADEIANEVDVILNSAANTNFNERYDVALDLNTRGPCRLMNFAKKCKKLKLLVQVSTAYVNGERQGRILEKLFSIGDNIARERVTSLTSKTSNIPILDVEAELKLAIDTKEAFQDNTVDSKMKDLGLERARIYGWQDTYVFTKAMGEMMIDSMRGEIPVVIIRPSIIESTCREPFPGWIEGIRMIDPVVLYYGKGRLSGFPVDPNGVIDIVPADMVVNATLAAMAKHGEARKPGINIYQIASSVENPLVFRDLLRLLYEHFKSSPYINSSGRPIVVSKMKSFNSIDDFSSQISTDFIQQSGRVPMAGKLSKRLEILSRKFVEQAMHMANIYVPYTFYGGRFDNTNTQKLMEDMSEEEKRSFGFDVMSIDWKDYISNVHIPGLRRHVMKGREIF